MPDDDDAATQRHNPAGLTFEAQDGSAQNEQFVYTKFVLRMPITRLQ